MWAGLGAFHKSHREAVAIGDSGILSAGQGTGNPSLCHISVVLMTSQLETVLAHKAGRGTGTTAEWFDQT